MEWLKHKLNVLRIWKKFSFKNWINTLQEYNCVTQIFQVECRLNTLIFSLSEIKPMNSEQYYNFKIFLIDFLKKLNRVFVFGMCVRCLAIPLRKLINHNPESIDITTHVEGTITFTVHNLLVINITNIIKCKDKMVWNTQSNLHSFHTVSPG